MLEKAMRTKRSIHLKKAFYPKMIQKLENAHGVTYNSISNQAK
jgi:hypothetical protein